KAAAFRLQEASGSIRGPGCFVAAVPTTYAGSEVTPVFGTTDLDRGRKSVVRSDPIRPRLALYDPELALETPPDLTASTGVHVLGGRYNAPHGVLNGIILPHAMRFNLPIAGKAYRELAPLLHVPSTRSGDAALGENVCQATSEFIRGLGLPQRLRDLGIAKTDLPSIAA